MSSLTPDSCKIFKKSSIFIWPELEKSSLQHWSLISLLWFVISLFIISSKSFSWSCVKMVQSSSLDLRSSHIWCIEGL